MSRLGSEAMDALEPFHPLLRQWFLERYRTPTDVQVQAWPIVSASRNILAIAPTGSGKTLCAFLWSIHQLLTGAWQVGETRVLYVSPLKALNNDIQRNLQQPLRELYGLFTTEKEPFPEIRVLTRSGDTPERERQQMIRRPPDILITTPESLNLLLSSPRARNMFKGLRTVILDEIHAVASSKRGTHLMTAVERLVPLAGEFQRIALSATVSPPERVAAFVGGYRLQRHGGEAGYLPRPVEIVQSISAKSLEISVRFPAVRTRPPLPGSDDRGDVAAGLGSDSQEGSDAGPSTVTAPKSRPTLSTGNARAREDPFWEPFVSECLERIRTNRSTLIFTNTRRHAEKVARLINERAGESLAYAHHGSLSREIRAVVEHKLKKGELSAIVATSSLELGIDIGELDEVLLLQTPFSVASALQRIGRAGHAVGEVSRGRLYATHGRDLLNAAVMAVLVRRGSIERVRPVECPLDVLAQVILSMTGIEPWGIDELYDSLRTSSPYRDLSRRHFDLVLDMLSGRYADTRLRELEPRVLLDRQGNTVRGRGSALPLIYRGGGTIPDRGPYELRLRDAGARIGELDEEFVWERKEGDTFNLGTQNWKITRIDERSVEVVPWSGPVGITPFWRAEKGARDYSFCERVGLFLERANERLDEDLTGWLQGELELDEEAAGALGGFLRRQKRATGTALPHRHHLLIEHIGGPLNRAGLRRVVLHTLWGGRVNEPLALLLSAAWERRYAKTAADARPAPEIFADDDCLMIVVPEGETASPMELDVGELLELATRGGSGAVRRIEELLRLRLEGSGFFGARFRENAGRALLLPRSDFRRRVPLWLTRLRSKNLLAAIRRYADFPLLLETWRSCLRDDFDLDTLEQLLGELEREEIRISEVRTAAPSPFAENIGWIQTNQHMYEGDAAGGGESRVPRGIISELLHAPHLRPRIDPDLVQELTQKLQRTARGYSPSDALELWDWVRERLVVPLDEWNGLLEAMRRDHGLDSPELLPVLEDRLVCCRLPGAAAWGVCARETLPRLLEAWSPGAWGPGEPAGVGEETASVETVPLEDVQVKDESQTDVVSPAVRKPPSPAAERPRLSTLSVLRGAISGREGSPSWDQAAVLGEWLRYYGPVEPRMLGELLGIPAARIEQVVESLVDGGLAVYDLLTTDAAEPQICDAENLETLLRQTRRARRPEVVARPLEELPLFLALRQGLVAADADPQRSAAGILETVRKTPSEEGGREALQGHLDKLFGYPAPAEIWEGEIFTARLFPYYGRWLDALLRDTRLFWFGCGHGRVAFGLSSDLALFREPRDPEKPSDRDVPLALSGARGSYGTWDLAERSGLSTGEVTHEIWGAVWDGRLTGEGFEVLRRGLRSGFRADLLSGGREGKDGSSGSGGRRSKRGGRSSFDRWRLSRPLEARWYVLEEPETVDLVEEEELKRDRVRQLLDRYGILFRELLQRELPLLRWARVFRTLRIMELSGEVLSGYFFESIQGLQFLAPEALAFVGRAKPTQIRPADLEIDVPEDGSSIEPQNHELLQDQPPGSQLLGDRVYWMNAADPASPCGLGLELPHLPARLPSNHLVYRGSQLVLVSSRRGRSLEFFAPPEDPRIREYLGFLRVLTQREWRPVNSLRVEIINAVPARDSPYKDALASFGFVEEFRGLVLRAAP